MTETLKFGVDGEWLTDFVRGWFWDEHRPYDVCKDLIASCLVGVDDETVTYLTNQILEGRKKFVGINEFDLVDDGKKIRPLSDEINRLRKSNEIKRIQLEITARGIDFIDPFSTVKSVEKAKEYGITTAEDCSAWFQYRDWDYTDVKAGRYAKPLPAAETATEAGLWMFSMPELVYECTDGGDLLKLGSDEFWYAVYEKMKDVSGFENRNTRYLASLRISKENISGPARTFDNVNSHLGLFEEPKVDNTLPCWSGLISPNGDFFPCGFAEHETVAHCLLNKHAKEWGQPVRVWADGQTEWGGMYGDALSTILELGWAACRFISGASYVSYKDEFIPDSHWQPTKEQKATLWNLVVKHKISSEIVPKIFF